jgi:hypothetical protein
MNMTNLLYLYKERAKRVSLCVNRLFAILQREEKAFQVHRVIESGKLLPFDRGECLCLSILEPMAGAR